MNAKFIISILTVVLFFESGYAQNQEAMDSITHELQEVIVTAKQPATKLVGSTLVSTILYRSALNRGRQSGAS